MTSESGLEGKAEGAGGRSRTDGELVLGARAGRKGDFGVLVERYERSMVAVAYGVLGNFADARDAAQESFLAAYRNLNQLAAPEKFAGWAMRITRRTAMAALKGRRNHGVLPKDVAGAMAARGSEGVSERVLMLIGRLGEGEREIVLLRYMDGLSTGEIARVTGRPLGTVTKQLSRAHEKLRNWMMLEDRK